MWVLVCCSYSKDAVWKHSRTFPTQFKNLYGWLTLVPIRTTNVDTNSPLISHYTAGPNAGCLTVLLATVFYPLDQTATNIMWLRIVRLEPPKAVLRIATSRRVP